MSDRLYATANGILRSAAELGLLPTALRQLPGYRATEVLERTLRTFTVDGRLDALREPSAAYSAPRTLDVLLGLGPPDLRVWLLVEDFHGTGGGPPLWVFEATLAAAIATLENHHLLEFYLVSRSSDWLVHETHHDVLIGVGDHAISVLDAVCTRYR